jgi:hypothetical protein
MQMFERGVLGLLHSTGTWALLAALLPLLPLLLLLLLEVLTQLLGNSTTAQSCPGCVADWQKGQQKCAAAHWTT